MQVQLLFSLELLHTSNQIFLFIQKLVKVIIKPFDGWENSIPTIQFSKVSANYLTT
jgi:hypothetical protein